MSCKTVLEVRFWSIDTTPYNSPRGIQIRKRHTPMLITQYKDNSMVIRNKAQRQKNTWAIALRKIPNKRKSIPSRLCSGTSITLMITGSSHICSHQQVHDHRKKRKTHNRTYINKRVSYSRKQFSIQLYTISQFKMHIPTNHVMTFQTIH